MEDPTSQAAPVPRRMLAAVALATLLNPLNSSMIAVALVPIQAAFRVSVSDATWLISAFYLAGAVGQPLMGRLGDQFGSRRVFMSGLALAGLTGAVAPLAPTIGLLAGLRGLQALGTAAAYPSGMAMVRAQVARASEDGTATTPAAALAVISIAANVSAAIGPTIGGALVQAAGWPAIFLVNVPATALCILMALRWLPGDPGGAPAVSLRSLVGLIDPLGVALFSITIGGTLALLLSLSSEPRWILLPLALASAVLLVWWELRISSPFFNVRMLAPTRGLAGVCAQFTLVNLAFYAIFFGLPLWLEKVRGAGPGEAGLIVMPITGLGVVATAAAAPLIRRWGPRRPLVLGAGVLCAGCVLLVLLPPAAPWMTVLAVIAVLGLPNGVLNLSLQALLFQSAGGSEMGAASGLFQTCRYVGSVLSTSLLGVVFAAGVTGSALHSLGAALTVISLLLLAASMVGLVRSSVAGPLPGHSIPVEK
jgi:MFS family permease